MGIITLGAIQVLTPGRSCVGAYVHWVRCLPRRSCRPAVGPECLRTRYVRGTCCPNARNTPLARSRALPSFLVAGVAVVNIDNGFGAAMMAAKVLRASKRIVSHTQAVDSQEQQ